MWWFKSAFSISARFCRLKKRSAFSAPDSVICTDFSLMSMVKSSSNVSVLTKRFAVTYFSEDSPPLPEMMSGVRASSMRMESTSSTMAKESGRCTICSRRLFKLSLR